MKSLMLAALVAGAGVSLMPVSASALCDPNGPPRCFVYGIPAADNPLWCEISRGAAASPEQGTYGYGYGVVPTTHCRTLSRRHR
jgi:hypothetical protein